MTIEEIQKYLTDIQNERFETKVLNAILTSFVEIKKLEDRVNILEEMIKEDRRAAEALKNEEDQIEDYTGSASLSTQEE